MKIFTKKNFMFSLYVAAGGSDDYAIDQGGIPLAFTLELGAEELNFAVPESHLKQTLNEGWIVIKAMTLEALKI
jgi:Zinc carboxypeptidase